MRWKRRRRRRESDEEEEAELEVWRRSRRRRERGVKARGEGGGFEEAALRTRTTERPVRRQSARGRRKETHAEGKTEKEMVGEQGGRREGERVRDGRDQPSQLQRERTASLANHSRFSSRLAILFEIEQRGENEAEKFSSHHPSFRVIGADFEIYRVSRYSADLSSSTTKGWDQIGRDERHSLEHSIDLDVPADS